MNFVPNAQLVSAFFSEKNPDDHQLKLFIEFFLKKKTETNWQRMNVPIRRH